MRTLVFLLLLANLTLFGYIKLDSIGGGEGVRLSQQVQPAKITLLSPQQVAALGRQRLPMFASNGDLCPTLTVRARSRASSRSICPS